MSDSQERDTQQPFEQESVWTPPPGYPMPPVQPISAPPRRKKRKWIAGLLSAFIPGTGYLYLGLMGKGVTFMLAVVFNICAIVFAATELTNLLSILLVSLMLPILYFYILFDSLQSTDLVNDRLSSAAPGGWAGPNGWRGNPPPDPVPNGGKSMPMIAILLLGGAAILILLMTNNNWSGWFLRPSGTLIGAIVLVGVGIVLWLRDSRGQRGKKS